MGTGPTCCRPNAQMRLQPARFPYPPPSRRTARPYVPPIPPARPPARSALVKGCAFLCDRHEPACAKLTSRMGGTSVTLRRARIARRDRTRRTSEWAFSDDDVEAWCARARTHVLNAPRTTRPLGNRSTTRLIYSAWRVEKTPTQLETLRVHISKLHKTQTDSKDLPFTF